MTKVLPYSMQDVHYDNDKFRPRGYLQGISLSFSLKSITCNYVKCTTGRLLMLLMICGVMYLIAMHQTPFHPPSTEILDGVSFKSLNTQKNQGRNNRIGRLWQKPPRLPPQLPPEELLKKTSAPGSNDSDSSRIWAPRQEAVRKAFIHAWSGYKKYAMGYDELMPLSKRGVDGLGGLGATIVDSLDTSLIMGLNDISSEARNWIENNLAKRISEKGQVNLFETTIRVLGGLLSAYNLSEKPQKYLEIAKNLADRLLLAFTSSPTVIPFSDVILHDKSAHAAPDGLSSTAEVSTLQLEFGYLSQISGDPKYGLEAMKVFEHMKKLPKVEGLVPIFINPYTGEFSGENIRLGSRGDSYYEYLIKTWIQQGGDQNSQLKYLHEMYEEAMKGVRNLLVRKSIPKGLVFVGELPYGHSGTFSPKMDHLVCFLPGTLALGATKGLTKRRAMEEKSMTEDDFRNLKLAEDLAKTCFEIYAVTATGLAPEIVYFKIEGGAEEHQDGGNHSSEYINDIIIKPADHHNLLRPETVESLFVLYRITEDPKYREWGWQIFNAFEKHTRIDSGGYTSLDDVTVVPPPKRDKMETFFLGETLKYLYLLFGDRNVLPLDKYVFNTEAHPLPVHRNSAAAA